MLKGADMKKQTRKQFGTGFTLVELLVVIAIIALLLSILMPALSKVRAQAQCLVCKTRMKDIGNMFNVYMQDNGNKLPPSYATDDEIAIAGAAPASVDPGKRWYQRLARYYSLKTGGTVGSLGVSYYNKMFRCPTQEKWGTPAGQAFLQKANGTASVAAIGMFGYNRFFYYTISSENPAASCAQWTWWQKPEAVKQPSELPLLGDTSVGPYKGLGDYTGGGNILKYDYPHPLAIKYGWGKGKQIQQIATTIDVAGPAPNHGTPNCDFLMADLHVDGKNVCVAGKWPWLPDSAGRTTTGIAFHPTRTIFSNGVGAAP